MDKTIYIVRHGQSETNISGEFAGQLDTPLSELGIKQSLLLLDFFSGIQIEEIYSSSLQRAYNTIKPVAEKFNINIKTDNRIKEIYGGDWQGDTYKHINEVSKTFQTTWKTNLYNARCDNGESIKELCDRVIDFLLEIVKKSTAKNIIISTHAVPIRAILSYLTFGTCEKIADISWTVNAGISVIKYENGKLYVKDKLISSHLKDLITILPTTV